MASPLDVLKNFDGGQMAAIIHKIGGEANACRLLRGEMKCTLELVKLILTINRSKPFDPATFADRGVTIWRGPADGKGLEGEEQQDARSLALTEVDLLKAARFETCLNEGETTITGEERLRRLKKKDLILPDASFGQALYEEPGQTTLKWLYKTYGVIWFELPGTELRSSDGHRFFLCLDRCGNGQWHWRYYWLDVARRAGSPALVLAKSELGT